MSDSRDTGARSSLWVWISICVVLAAMPLVRFATRRARAPLPVLYSIPSWALTDQRSAPFGTAQLQGHSYVVDFVFTTCLSACPILSARMASLQPRIERIAGAPRLVSITVDPQNDTPERLQTYARRFRAREGTWTFVTGPEASVLGVLEHGFRVAVESPPRGPHGEFNPLDLAHSNRFLLIDGRGRLRGTYAADQNTEIDRLVADLALLSTERN